MDATFDAAMEEAAAAGLSPARAAAAGLRLLRHATQAVGAEAFGSVPPDAEAFASAAEAFAPSAFLPDEEAVEPAADGEQNEMETGPEHMAASQQHSQQLCGSQPSGEAFGGSATAGREAGGDDATMDEAAAEVQPALAPRQTPSQLAATGGRRSQGQRGEWAQS